MKEGNEFKPTYLGAALIQAYKAVKLELYKPSLRAEMEKDMTNIAEG